MDIPGIVTHTTTLPYLFTLKERARAYIYIVKKDNICTFLATTWSIFFSKFGASDHHRIELKLIHSFATPLEEISK